MTSRREFLKTLLALAAAGASFHPLSAWAMEEKSRSCLLVGSGRNVCFVDLEKFSAKIVNLGFNPHSFVPHPHDPMRFIAMEKWGPTAADVNFEKNSVMPLPSENHYQFYGHGIYVPERKVVFVNRVNSQTGLGYMTGYDPETYKIVHDFEATPGGLHDCHRMPDNTYFVASTGLRGTYSDAGDPLSGERLAASSLVRIDLAGTGKVVGELAIDDPDQIIGHFAATKTGQILALSGRRPSAKSQHGYLYYSPDGTKPLRQLEFPKDIQETINKDLAENIRTRPMASRDMLSVALNSDHTRAAVTSPDMRKVFLVDMVQGKILKAVTQFTPNVAFDPTRKQFVGGGAELAFLDETFTAETKQPVKGSPRVGGAHSILVSSKISV